MQQNLDMLAGRIAELLAQSETLGEAGDIDGAQAAIAQLETLKVGHSPDSDRAGCNRCTVRLHEDWGDFAPSAGSPAWRILCQRFARLRASFPTCPSPPGVLADS